MGATNVAWDQTTVDHIDWVRALDNDDAASPGRVDETSSPLDKNGRLDGCHAGSVGAS
jgi:hypothetical protein